MYGGERVPKGASGRVVIELDPSMKRELYSVLAEEGLTLKDWFTREVERHIREHREPSLFTKARLDGDDD
jgi:hypothetical protein